MWHRLPRPWRIVATAVAVVVLFTAIGLGSTATSSRGASPHPGLLHAEATLVTIFLAWLAVVAAVAAVWALTAKGSAPGPGPLGRYSRARTFLVLLAIAALVYLARRVFTGKKDHPSSPPARLPTPQAVPSRPSGGRLVDPRVVTTGIVIAILLTAVAVACIIWWDRRSRGVTDVPSPDAEPELPRTALAHAVEAALGDLDAEPDPRRAVIAAYARMERVLQGRGLPRRSWETPVEYLDRMLRELGGRADSVDRLTRLFELAKFSHHPVTGEMKQQAIDALTDLRAELAADPAGAAAGRPGSPA